MAYSLDLLFTKQPDQRLVIPIEDSDPQALFIARWPSDQFATHGELVQLTELYDSAMQGFIQGMGAEELVDWFVPYDDRDPAETPDDVKVLRHEDATEWMKRNHPHVSLPWLSEGNHVAILQETEEFGYLMAYGAAGYFYVFAADML